MSLSQRIEKRIKPGRQVGLAQDVGRPILTGPREPGGHSTAERLWSEVEQPSWRAIATRPRNPYTGRWPPDRPADAAPPGVAQQGRQENWQKFVRDIVRGLTSL